jgi:hypothetical protein
VGKLESLNPINPKERKKTIKEREGGEERQRGIKDIEERPKKIPPRDYEENQKKTPPHWRVACLTPPRRVT